MKVYLAGGMKSGWQQRVKEAVPQHQYLDPSTHGLDEETQYTLWDLRAICSADILFVYFEANNPSGYGLSLEVGYGAALGKHIILVDEKSRSDFDVGRRLGMLRACSHVVVQSLDDGLRVLQALAKIWNIHLLDANNLIAHPAYAKGRKRVGCVWCVNSGEDDLVRDEELYPKRCAELRALRREIGLSSTPAGISQATLFPLPICKYESVHCE